MCLTPLQGRIWPSSHLARGHTAHTTSYQQVHDKPQMDPPRNTTSSWTLLCPKGIFSSSQAAAGEQELVSKHRYPLSY